MDTLGVATEVGGEGSLPAADPEQSGLDSLIRLAAARAALDPERRAWRSDILLSAVIEAIGLYGPQPADRLLRHVGRVWAAGSVAQASLDTALVVAADAGLLQRSQSLLSDQEEWSLTELTRTEADQDRSWVKRTFTTFGEQIVERANLQLEKPVGKERAESLAEHMLAALAVGASGSYELARGVMSLGELRPAVIDVAAARRHLLQAVEPKPVAEAMQAVLVPLLNPDNDFGNEVLRLLVVGNILQGVLSGRDLALDLRVSDMRFALDTSTLMNLLGDGSSEKRLLLDFLDRCAATGAPVVVAEHTLDEWERVWAAADAEVQSSEVAAVVRAGEAYPLVRNPVARQFVRYLTQDETGNWTRFALGLRDPRRLLEAHGVTVRHHRNVAEEDVALVEAVEARLNVLSRDERTRGARTTAGARDDAQTSAMVARWRSRRGEEPPLAWVIAKDRLTNLAYRAETDSPYPICVSLEAAALLLASLCGDDESSVAALSETLGRAVTRDSFFAVAASYSLDEIIDLSVKMSPDTTLSAEDASIAVQLNFESMLTEAERSQSQEERKALATRAVQLRGTRRLSLADRTFAAAEQAANEAAAREDRVREQGVAKGRSDRDDELEEARKREGLAEAKVVRTKRYAALGMTSTVIVVSLVLLLTLGVVEWSGAFLATIVLGLNSANAVRYVRDEKSSTLEFIGHIAVSVATIALAFVPSLFD